MSEILFISGWAHGVKALDPLPSRLEGNVSVVSLDGLLREAQDLAPPPTEGEGAPLSPYARAVVERVKRAFAPVRLMGWSTGGMVAVEVAAALECRGIAGLVLVSSTARFVSDVNGEGVTRPALRLMRQGMKKNPEAMLRDFIFRAADPDVLPEAETERRIGEALAVGAETLLHGLGYLASADLRPMLDRITVPCLVIHGEKDRIISSGAGHCLAAGIPHAHFRVIPDAGHLLFPRYAESISSEIATFSGGPA